MRGKRLFWISIIIVELVLVYVVWKPIQTHLRRPIRRTTMSSPVVRRPEVKSPQIVIESRKPTAGSLHRRWRRSAPIVNASLKSPEPVVPPPAAQPKIPLSPMESFWCHISTIDSNCDCKTGSDQQTKNLLQP